MENKVNLPLPQLFTLGEDVAHGLATYGATVGIVRNIESVVRVDLDAAILARDIYEAGAQTLRDKNEELRTITKSARTFARLTRDMLIPTLGGRYSAAWNQAGLVGSLTIPSKRQLVQGLVQSQRSYLANHPDLEIEDKITAVIAGQHLDALADARSAVLIQETVLKNLLLARDVKVAALRKRLRLFIAELGERIGPVDAYWLSFGLKQPGLRARPDAPTNLAAVLMGNNAVSVRWDKARRAEYYRVWMRVVGQGDEFLSAGSPSDRDFILEGLPANSVVEIAVSAMNNGGESSLSEIITMQLA